MKNFSSESQALAWLASEVDDLTADNWRVGYSDIEESVLAYEDAVAAGCCGSMDIPCLIEGRQAIVGCNYGH